MFKLDYFQANSFPLSSVLLVSYKRFSNCSQQKYISLQLLTHQFLSDCRVWGCEAACRTVLDHFKYSFRKQSYPGHAPSQPSGMEESADKCDAFIHSGVW